MNLWILTKNRTRHPDPQLLFLSGGQILPTEGDGGKQVQHGGAPGEVRFPPSLGKGYIGREFLRASGPRDRELPLPGCLVEREDGIPKGGNGMASDASETICWLNPGLSGSAPWCYPRYLVADIDIESHPDVFRKRVDPDTLPVPLSGIFQVGTSKFVHVVAVNTATVLFGCLVILGQDWASSERLDRGWRAVGLQCGIHREPKSPGGDASLRVTGIPAAKPAVDGPVRVQEEHVPGKIKIELEPTEVDSLDPDQPDTNEFIRNGGNVRMETNNLLVNGGAVRSGVTAENQEHGLPSSFRLGDSLRVAGKPAELGRIEFLNPRQTHIGKEQQNQTGKESRHGKHSAGQGKRPILLPNDERKLLTP